MRVNYLDRATPWRIWARSQPGSRAHQRARSNGQGHRVAERHVDEALRPGCPLSKCSPPLHQGARTHVGYAGARNGLNFRSALAAKIKSLSVRPLILCDQISILHFPQARYRSG